MYMVLKSIGYYYRLNVCILSKSPSWNLVLSAVEFAMVLLRGGCVVTAELSREGSVPLYSSAALPPPEDRAGRQPRVPQAVGSTGHRVHWRLGRERPSLQDSEKYISVVCKLPGVSVDEDSYFLFLNDISKRSLSHKVYHI